MRFLLVVAMLSVAACSRKVTVQTAPAAQVEVSLKVTNKTSQPITIFVTAGGTEQQVGVVGANKTELIPVRNVSAGTSARLRAALADGSRSYTREGAVLNGVFEWQVP